MNEYWTILRRKRLLILGCVAGGLTLAGVLNGVTTPVYRSSVRVEVQREPSRSPLTGAPTETPTPQSESQMLYTIAQIVTSQAPMAQVVEALDRQGTVLGPGIQRFAFLKWQPVTPKSLSEKVAWLLAHVTVEPVRDTRLIRISVEHSHPATAATIANTIAENFVRYHLSQRSAVDNGVATYLRAQAEDVNTKIRSLEQATRGANRSGLFSIEAKIQQLTASAGELNANRTKTTTEQLALSSQLDRIRGIAGDSTIDPTEVPIHSETLDALRRDLVVSNTALAKARDIYGANHPKLALLQAENDEIRRNIRDEINAAVSTLQSQYSILVEREAKLQTTIAQVEDDLRALNDQARKYSSIEADLRSSRELYNLLISRVHEAEITGRLTRPLVRVVEAASVAPDAVRPRKAMNFAIGLALGMLTGAGLAFLFESLRKVIRTPRDVDDALQLPVIGVVPKRLDGQATSPIVNGRPASLESNGHAASATAMEFRRVPVTPIGGESIRVLSSTLSRVLSEGKRSILITSSGPGEGKSTIAAALARRLAQSGRQGVVLVDADTVRPRVHELFQLDNRRGLEELLNDVYHVDLNHENPDQFGVGDWIELIRAQFRTGKLEISEGSERFSIVFRNGKVSSLFEHPGQEATFLGEMLVAQGRIAEEQLASALRVQEEGSHPLGEVLQSLGYLGPAELETALQQQFQERLHKFLTMRQPRYRFSEMAETYLPAAASAPTNHGNGCSIDRFVVKMVGDYLKQPYLSSQVPGYLKNTGVENLKVLTSGERPYDLSDARFAAPFAMVMDRLAKRFDVVLIDSPPVAFDSATTSLASTADGVVLVVKANDLSVGVIQQAKEHLVRSGANILGVVLNQADLFKDEALPYYHGVYR